jgi:catechol 2,3-dioxygenase
MAVTELGHVVLYVHNLARSAAFYRDVLGLDQLTPDTPGLPDPSAPQPLGLAAFSGTAHRTHHELLLIEVGEDAAPQPRGRRVGLYHLGLKVGDRDDDLRAARARLDAAGVTIVGASDHGVSHSLYLLDPDGNEIELYVDVPGVDWRTDPMAVLSPTKPLAL